MSRLSIAENKARDIVNGWAVSAAAVGWVPFSCFVLSPAEYSMVEGVAEAFAVEEYDAEAVLTVLIGNLVGHAVADTALSFVPVVGWAIKSAVASGMVKSLGEAVIDHFREKSPYRYC